MQRVAVVIPAYREERLIGRTLAAIPAWVSAIYVVDDASPDATAERVLASGDARVRLLRHSTNRGVGAAIVSGYRRALAEGADVLVVMAGDNQMDPRDLPRLVRPIELGEADYVKGNRFTHPEVRAMPRHRRIGGQLLAAATRLASGLRVSDTQCGYTALSARAAHRLPLGELWPRFGYPNDLLLMAAEAGLAVREVSVRPVYADEESGVRAWHAASILLLIGRRWWHQRQQGDDRAALEAPDTAPNA